MVLLTLVFAFLVGSFVARNSDIFLHLAAGKRLFAGTYTPGSDPFSFTAADRAWVNHSLFFDIGTYLLYSGSGGTLVVLKAIAVAAAFALVIAIRRPGFSLWPWAAVAAIGVVAAAPYVHLRPNVASMVLLALTLFLLIRGPHSETSWRFPISIGVVFWVWANTDEWFFLGPMALALVLVGEAIQRSPKSEETGTQEDTLGSLPSVKTLARALGIGVVACMLNPHHVRIWELPFELVGSKELMADIRFKTLLVTPLDRYYVDNAGLGYNANGLAYALLFVGGGVALGLAGSRVRVAHIALWVGFAALTIGTVYAIPFLALVAVPIIASQVNVLSSNATLTTWGNPRTRFLLLGSAGGRVLSLIVLVVACVLTVPGWIHPGNSSVFARRVGWAVEPEESMVKAAGQLQMWRTNQQLPPEAHGFNTSLEFANYCAWFAPDEKVYANSRYNHHLPELPNFLAVRIGMGLVPTDERPNPKVLPETLQKAGVEYVLIHSGPGDSVQFRGFALNAARVEWSDPDHWSPWYLDGRTTICGWRPAPGKEKPTFTGLHVDPVSLAFGPEVERVPPVTTLSVPRFGGWEDAFLRSPGFTPPGVDEVGMWQLYNEVRQRFFGQRQLILDTASVLVTRVGVMFPRVLLPNDTPVAVPFLTLRAARRAIAADPNHPDGYFALYRALHEPTLPLSEPERALGQLTALRQCLERMPPPEEYRPNTYATSPTQVAFLLAELYLGRRQDTGNLTPGVLLGDNPGFFILRSLGAAGVVRVVNNNLVRMPAATQQGLFPPPYYLLALDLARETFQKAENYAKVEITDPKGMETILTGIKNEMKVFESELARANNTLESRRAGKSVREQVEMALQLNLGNEALRLLTAKDLNYDKEFSTESFEFLLCRVALELGLGKIEDATSDLDQIANADGVKQRLGNPGVRTLL
ncbi:MAG: hypothetical protein U0792_18290 [Gemmataceae bacterium]